MPVIIAPENRDSWLNGPDADELLKPCPSHLMRMWPVSPKLNSVKMDTPDLMDVVDERSPKLVDGDVPREIWLKDKFEQKGARH